MQENSAKTPIKDENQSAANALSSYFDDDMATVNQIIIDHMDSSVPLVKQVATYLVASGGKRIRPLLTLAGSSLCNGINDNTHKLAAAVEFIHTATLLHDDVVDESDQRRGKPSANNNFGNQTPILVGDFLFSRAFQLMVSTQNIDALKILSDASATIAEGEVLQLAIQGKLDIDINQYFTVLKGKTAVLFAAAIQSGTFIAGADDKQNKAAYDFGINLGMCFQIIDDLIDYKSEKEVSGKNKGDDFFDGKITLPVFIAYQNGTAQEKEFWHSCFKNPRTENELEEAYNLFEKHDAFEQTYKSAAEYHSKALSALNVFADNHIKDLLINLLDFTLNRNY